MSKNYVIIGGSSDVALSYIKHINDISAGSDKASVIAHYAHNDQGLKALSDQCRNVDLYSLQADLTDEAAVDKLTDAIMERFDHVDYFLHFPALPFDYMRYKELDSQKIKQELDVQLFSFLNISKKLFPAMKKVADARAVVMLTKYVADPMPPKFMVSYVVTKYALLGAMKAAAAEFGGGKFMINGLSPVMMDTKFLCNMDPHIIEMNKAQSPIGRIIKPDEIVPYIDKLLSADCDFNGTNLSMEEEDFD